MLLLKLAYRNLVGAKLRTWLNVGILSFVYVLCIWHMALFDGMNNQAVRATTSEQVAGGQIWNERYRPDDPLAEPPFSGTVSRELARLVEMAHAEPVLTDRVTIYPRGRAQSVQVNGISPNQQVLQLPTNALNTASEGFVPVLIGRITARAKSLKVGDTFLIRWRDRSGVFDAREGQVVEIMNTTVSAIDNGQIWVPLAALREMLGAADQASYIILPREHNALAATPAGWNYKAPAELLSDVLQVVRQKRAGSLMMYVIMMSLILLAVFDSQVLSILRRRKEIGTLMAMGLTRRAVVALFTLEGTLNAMLALGVALIYGLPFWAFSAIRGLALPAMSEEAGLPVPEVIYPEYAPRTILSVVVAVLVAVALVSYWPSRRVAKLQPSEALRGRT